MRPTSGKKPSNTQQRQCQDLKEPLFTFMYSSLSNDAALHYEHVLSRLVTGNSLCLFRQSPPRRITYQHKAREIDQMDLKYWKHTIQTTKRCLLCVEVEIEGSRKRNWGKREKVEGQPRNKEGILEEKTGVKE